MSFIPTPNAVTVTINFSMGGEEFSTSLSFLGTTPAGTGDLTALGAVVSNWVVSHLVPPLSEQLSYTGMVLYAQDSAQAPLLAIAVDPAVPGGDAQNSSPAQVAAVVKFDTPVRGRTGQGRAYIPGIGESNVGVTGVNSTFVTALQAAYDALPGALIGSGYQHVIISKTLNGQPRSQGVPTVVNQYIARNVVGTQRRRVRT